MNRIRIGECSRWLQPPDSHSAVASHVLPERVLENGSDATTALVMDLGLVETETERVDDRNPLSPSSLQIRSVIRFRPP